MRRHLFLGAVPRYARDGVARQVVAQASDSVSTTPAARAALTRRVQSSVARLIREHASPVLTAPDTITAIQDLHARPSCYRNAYGRSGFASPRRRSRRRRSSRGAFASGDARRCCCQRIADRHRSRALRARARTCYTSCGPTSTIPQCATSIGGSRTISSSGTTWRCNTAAAISLRASVGRCADSRSARNSRALRHHAHVVMLTCDSRANIRSNSARSATRAGASLGASRRASSTATTAAVARGSAGAFFARGVPPDGAARGSHLRAAHSDKTASMCDFRPG